MSVTRSSKYVTDYNRKNVLTHFLCLPLLGAASKLQYRKSVRQFLNDLASATVPRGAIRPPGVLHIGLGPMSLTTPDRLAAASSVLKSIDVEAILHKLEDQVEKGICFSAERFWSDISSRPKDKAPATPTLRISPAPLEITVSKLKSSEASSSPTSRLFAQVSDSTHRLGPFCLAARQAFKSAGLLHKPIGPAIESEKFNEENISSSNSRATFMNTGLVPRNRDVPSRTPGKLQKEPRSRIETKVFLTTYENHIWMKTQRLEKLSICRMGVARGGGGLDSDIELSEISSIPLP
ncbi:hypothetical protein MMC28_011202 [Mycoblastus sanguinarius]|nr:hypothetical protein [Mycoblastus sanguinarius]